MFSCSSVVVVVPVKKNDADGDVGHYLYIDDLIIQKVKLNISPQSQLSMKCIIINSWERLGLVLSKIQNMSSTEISLVIPIALHHNCWYRELSIHQNMWTIWTSQKIIRKNWYHVHIGDKISLLINGCIRIVRVRSVFDTSKTLILN